MSLPNNISQVTCPNCQGHEEIPRGSTLIDCPTCGAVGWVWFDAEAEDSYVGDCPLCEGTGRAGNHADCPDCEGHGEAEFWSVSALESVANREEW